MLHGKDLWIVTRCLVSDAGAILWGVIFMAADKA